MVGDIVLEMRIYWTIYLKIWMLKLKYTYLSLSLSLSVY